MSPAGFRRTRAGRLVVRLDEAERTALRDLLHQLIEMVGPQGPAATDPLARMVGIESEATRPADPALARLLPDGYDGADDPEAAAEFRRFTERSLREAKVAGARTMLDSLERSGAKVVLSEGEAQSWLTGLNDLRLTLGTRLAIDEDPDVMDARITALGRDVLAWTPDDPDSAARARAAMESLAAHHLYDWLTFLQETLVRAVSGVVVDPDDD